MKYILSLLSILIFVACGNSSSQETSLKEKRTVSMEAGKVYNVKKGDKLIKTTDDAIVKITKKTQEETTEVVLLSGEAKIIYK